MLGAIDSFTIQWSLSIACFVAAITDLWKGQIYNWLTLPLALIGLLGGFFIGHWSGLGNAFLGYGIGLFLFGILYQLRILGGGDVKFLAAAGTFGGALFIVKVAILSILLGGFFAALVLLSQGRLVPFVKKLLFARFVPMNLDQKSTLPFGVPLAVATLWVIHADPFIKVGLG